MFLTRCCHAERGLTWVNVTCAGAASGSADADKKEKAPKGGTAVKVTLITSAPKTAPLNYETVGFSFTIKKILTKWTGHV